MKIGVAGAGSVGGYFGGLIEKSGYDVLFLARGDHLHAMKEKGLRLETEEGDFYIPGEFTNDYQKFILLSSKAGIKQGIIRRRCFRTGSKEKRWKSIRYVDTLLVVVKRKVLGPLSLVPFIPFLTITTPAPWWAVNKAF
jgi:hypothetical protein